MGNKLFKVQAISLPLGLAAAVAESFNPLPRQFQLVYFAQIVANKKLPHSRNGSNSSTFCCKDVTPIYVGAADAENGIAAGEAVEEAGLRSIGEGIVSS